jgi:two-component system, NarL family, response regulator DesR
LIRILIADDQPSVRAAVRHRVEVEDDMTVVAEVGDGAAAVARVGQTLPDLVILDYRMPRTDGIRAARSIARFHPGVGMVLRTSEADPALVARAVRAGVRGYVLKTEPLARLVEAIRVVAGGGSRLPAVDLSETEERRPEVGRRRP